MKTNNNALTDKCMCRGNMVGHAITIEQLGLEYRSVTFHRSMVQVTASSINYQTTQIPLNLIELEDTFNAIHLSLSW